MSKFNVKIANSSLGAQAIGDHTTATGHITTTVDKYRARTATTGSTQAPLGAPGGRIRILFLGANPSDTSRLALDREVRAIMHSIRSSSHLGNLQFMQEWAIRLADLQRTLLHNRPQIVHFSGHGSLDWGSGGILVEDDFGNALPIPISAFADLFRIVKGVRCVVLNACNSVVQAEAIRQHVDTVVGMNRPIEDQAAINFAWAFYQGLENGESIRTAFDLGVNQIKLEGSCDDDVPQLLVRDGIDPQNIFLTTAGKRADSGLCSQDVAASEHGETTNEQGEAD